MKGFNSGQIKMGAFPAPNLPHGTDNEDYVYAFHKAKYLFLSQVSYYLNTILSHVGVQNSVTVYL